MAEQLIISVSREFGSGGHTIAEQLAERFGLPLYDHNLLDKITNEKNLDLKKLKQYDERPRNPLLSRTVRGYSNSPEENIAKMQFEYLQEKAEQGDSFVVVGRCSESVLKEYDSLIAIFILANMDFRIQRTMIKDGLSQRDAEALVKRRTRERKAYHNRYCTMKWGDSRNYDITMDSSKLDIEGTADVLENYIRARIQKKQNG